jgi:phosphoglycolate phosphatase-like HAD superfamily hydrolase
MNAIDRSRVRAVLFDIDGTLADTDDQAVRFAARLLAPLGLHSAGRGSLPRRLIMAAEGPVNALLNLADRLMVDELVGPALEAVDRKRGGKTGGSPALIPDVEALLENLAPKFPLAIVTTRGDVRTRRFLAASHLDRFFSTVITARSTRRTKPHPEPVVRAAQELGLAPQDCVIVGDTTVDIRAGRAAGAQTIGVLCGFGEREELERAGADLILGTTADLASILLDV